MRLCNDPYTGGNFACTPCWAVVRVLAMDATSCYFGLRQLCNFIAPSNASGCPMKVEWRSYCKIHAPTRACRADHSTPTCRIQPVPSPRMAPRRRPRAQAHEQRPRRRPRGIPYSHRPKDPKMATLARDGGRAAVHVRCRGGHRIACRSPCNLPAASVLHTSHPIA